MPSSRQVSRRLLAAAGKLRFQGPPPPAVMTLAPSDGTNAGIFGLNSTHVFFNRYDSNVSVSIWSVPKTGGSATLLATAPYVGGKECCASYIIADDQFVYWTDYFHAGALLRRDK